MLNSAMHVKNLPESNGKLGATGFCWGGGTTNFLAVQMGNDLHAGAPFYGSAPSAEDVASIQAPLVVHNAEDDKRINGQWPDFEAALKENNKTFEHHLYAGTKHGFHNNFTPRYNKEAADLAWERTLGLFKSTLM